MTNADHAQDSLAWLPYAQLAAGLQALNEFCDIKQIEAQIPQLTQPKSDLLLGFEMAASVALYEVADAVVTTSYALGIEGDPSLRDRTSNAYSAFWQGAQDTTQARIIANLRLLRTKIRSATTWEELKPALLQTQSYTVLLLKTLDETSPIRFETDHARDILRSGLLARFLVENLLNEDGLSWNISNVQAKPAGSLGYQPPMPPPDLEDGSGAARPNPFFPGIRAAATFLASRLPSHASIEALRIWIASAENISQLDDLYHTAHEAIKQVVKVPSLSEPSGVELLPNRAASEQALALLTAPQGDFTFEEVNCAAFFDYRPVRMIVNGDALAARTFFDTVFLGSCKAAIETGDKVQIVELRHPDNRGIFYSSYAILQWVRTALANHSEYWMFYYVGSSKGGGSGLTRRAIEARIEAQRDLVNRITHTVPDEESLRNYLRSRPLSMLAERTKRYGEHVKAFRGALSELVVGELLRAEKWDVRALRHKSSATGGREIDIVATRLQPQEELLIVEVKTSLSSIPVSHFDLDVQSAATHLGAGADQEARPSLLKVLERQTYAGHKEWSGNDNCDDVVSLEAALTPVVEANLRAEFGLSPKAVVRKWLAVTGTMSGPLEDRLPNWVLIPPAEFVKRCQQAKIPKSYYSSLRDARWMDVDDDNPIHGDSLADALMDPDRGNFYQ